MENTQFWDEVARMREELDALYANYFVTESGKQARPPSITPAFRKPLADFVDDKNEFVAILEMPGLDKKDIHISSDGRALEIKAEKTTLHGFERKDFWHEERAYTGFYRYIILPEESDVNNISATYNNGLLTVHIQKVPGKTAKKIDVNIH